MMKEFNRLGFKSVVVYHGETFLGEVTVLPAANSNFSFPNNEIRISHVSPTSERTPPLSVIQTIASYSVRCKLDSALPPEQQPNLFTLYSTCYFESKTAVALLGNEEIHLVAMANKKKNSPCFWCCTMPVGLYNSCLRMLNMRCLAIVFDLDETLIVANTMKSFEDRIEALKGWISMRETDQVRAAGMSAELKRYTDDRALLKQYLECDCVTDGGRIYKAQLEEVPVSSENHEKIVRPIIRLPERNIVLTRINPEIRDTSVLVRLRPAWEDLRSYLTAKGRKRFEVFVCTMAERDYALEMWRLLDPEANLINTRQLVTRVVCVKSGSRKSLLNVFQDGSCHPHLAMVIDDRMKVWEDKDQSRVHVVPAFTPYYAPQAETAHAVPVLCVARNVACNVRAGFFKDYDENIHKRICDMSYEDETSSLPPPPDVGNFLILEDTGFVPNGNANIPIPEGMYGAEVEHRLHHPDKKLAVEPPANVSIAKPEILQLPPISAPSVANPPILRAPTSILKPSLLGVPVKRDGFSSESDLDKKRRFSMMQHGIDTRIPISSDPPILKSPAQLPSVSLQAQASWLPEDVTKGPLINQVARAAQLKTVGPNAMLSGPVLNPPPRGRAQEVGARHERLKQNPPANQISVGGASDVAFPRSRLCPAKKEFQPDPSRGNALNSALSITVLQEIARRCNSKVEFRSVVSTRHDLQFSVEVLFTGERIGIGMGKTRKDAQQQAAEHALRSLSDHYLEYVGRCASGTDGKNFDKQHSNGKENGFIWDEAGTIPEIPSADQKLPKESTCEAIDMEIETSSSMVNQQEADHLSSPSLQKPTPNQPMKEETPNGSQGILPQPPQKNGRPL